MNSCSAMRPIDCVALQFSPAALRRLYDSAHFLFGGLPTKTTLRTPCLTLAVHSRLSKAHTLVLKLLLQTMPKNSPHSAFLFPVSALDSLATASPFFQSS